MHLLNPGGGLAGDDDLVLRQAFAVAAGFAQNADGGQAVLSAQLQRRHQVGGIAAARKGHQCVAGASQPLHLAGKHGVKPEIIGDAGEQRGVGAQANGGQGPSVLIEPAHEFLGEMQGVGGAAAVAAGQELAAVGQAGGQNLTGLFHHRHQAAKVFHRGAERFKLLGDSFHKVRGICSSPPGRSQSLIARIWVNSAWFQAPRASFSGT